MKHFLLLFSTVILSVPSLVFFVCISCVCTQKVCKEGVSIVVQTNPQEPFPDGDYLLTWSAGNISGELEPVPYSPLEDGELIFWPNYNTTDGKPVPTSNHTEITFQLFYNGNSLVETKTYDLDWTTEVCNTCTGLKDDIDRTYAEVEIFITAPE